ncbi:hypothetical protein NHX12_002933 [Muraenolepis orangiensis]|uniref:DUF4537 domain-containing protein n=1 Tax=Muraenolepis orangiensis TaxID=630683 RepID=A0A9Q0DXJ4_9TELE|nr:hypothetical protein NHX12_002933 [Muraenolepis orangiensis]
MTPEVEVSLEMVPVFQGSRNQNVVFLLDTSDDMRRLLGGVKRLLIQTLLARSSFRESLFNIMAFSHQLNRWSQNMRPCVPHTVYEALSWIHSLTCGPGRELLSALSTALRDPDCHAVHLVTTGLPCHTDALLRVLPAVAGPRTVNVFYLLDHSRFFPDCRALARRQEDGLYYSGTVVQECRSGLWLVEWDHLEGSSTATMQQLVCSLDMIPHTGTHAPRLVPGDTVLSPWEPGVRRYGPGVVTGPMEPQDSLSDGGGTSLWVRMWSGCVALVPRSLVVPIPPSNYSRLVLELQQGVTASSHSWPCTPTPPWSHSSGCHLAPASCYCQPVPCHWPTACVCDLGSRDEHQRVELEDQASLLLENFLATETARSKSSLAMADGVTIVVSPLRVRPKEDQPRPPWRYWRRSTPEPQHRKPGEEVTSTSCTPMSSTLKSHCKRRQHQEEHYNLPGSASPCFRSTSHPITSQCLKHFLGLSGEQTSEKSSNPDHLRSLE